MEKKRSLVEAAIGRKRKASLGDIFKGVKNLESRVKVYDVLTVLDRGLRNGSIHQIRGGR